MPELRDVLVAESARGGPVATPPFETVIARARRRRVVQISSVVVIVVAVSAVVAIPTLVGGHRTTVVTADGTSATTEAARKALTVQAANEFADGVQLPAGASSLPTAPSQVLAEPVNSPGRQNLVDVVRFFIVPGTIDSVLAFVTAHPPKGMFGNGTESSGVDGVTVEQGVTFSALATHDYGKPAVDVVATKIGTGVAVRIDADLVWRPLRTAAEQVPVDAPATECRFTTTICAAGLVVADQATARELATFFNSLDPRPPGDEYCPAVTSYTKIEFATTHGSLAFDPSSCAGVVVSAGGVRQPTLELPDTVPVGLQTLLGLNADLASSPAPDLSAVSSFAVAPVSGAPASSPAR
jgi:hypothetical protein